MAEQKIWYQFGILEMI